MIYQIFLAWRLALRELRGGLRGFYIFIMCLFLGVVTIASIGTLASALVAGLAQRGQEILGGDLDLRLIHREARAQEVDYLRQISEVSHIATLRAMVRTLAPAGERGASDLRQLLVEAKAVDDLYPLMGSVTLTSQASMHDVLTRGPLKFDGTVSEQAAFEAAREMPLLFAAIAEPSLLAQLNLKIGDRVAFGDIHLLIVDTLLKEPDRLAGGFALGPRVMMREEALRASGLWQAGSLINHHYRLKLKPIDGTLSLDDVRAAIEQEFPLAGWRVRDRRDASPSVRRSIERIGLFLTLVGLTALSVGGVGVGNAITAFLDRRRPAIATFKALGAPPAIIIGVFMIHIGLIALLAMSAALMVAAFAPLAIAGLIADMIDLPLTAEPQIGALAAAASFGWVTAFGFMFVPLGKAMQTPVSVLFRGAADTQNQPRRPRAPIGYRVLALASLASVIGLSFWISDRRDIALWFIVIMAGSFICLRVSARLVQSVAAKLATRGGFHRRLAMRNIIAPGTPLTAITLSVGLSVILVTSLAMVQHNFDRQLASDFPDRAPSFFALDIQPDQIDAFRAFSREFPGFSDLQAVPMLRGAVLAVKDQPVSEIVPPSEIAWFLRGDRGLTYASTMPENSKIVAGDWWAEDYAGPPLISLDQRIASGLGLEVGDHLTVNILGRPLRAEIANLRRIDYGSGQINFAMVFSPEPLRNAPHSYLASISMAVESEMAFTQALTRHYRNVSLVRVKEAVQSVRALLDQFSFAIGTLSLTAITTSIFVLAGALTSSRQARLYEAAILGALGARRRSILRVFMLEYGFIGLGAALLGALIGTGTSWAVISLGLRSDWQFSAFVFISSVAGALGLALILAFVALRQQLGVPWRRILLGE